MKRIEEFSMEGKNFVYIDFSNLIKNEEFVSLSSSVESVIANYPEKSLYTITNVENVRFDSNSKQIVANYLKNNKPYVKCGAIIGFDGIKKIMISSMLDLGGRKNMYFAFSREQAIEWLLQQN